MKKQLLENYAKNQELVRQLQKEQKEMRDEIIAQMKKSVEQAGNYVAILTDEVRESIDKKLLIEEQGKDFVSQYTKETEYQKLNVKAA